MNYANIYRGAGDFCFCRGPRAYRSSKISTYVMAKATTELQTTIFLSDPSAMTCRDRALFPH